LAAVPQAEFLTWRLKHLRTFWRAQDWPVDLYSDGVLPADLQQLPRPPIIDPDVIGPDDFRDPLAKTDPNAPDQAFDLWLKRRQWVDGQLHTLSSITKQVNQQTLPNLDALFLAMYKPTAYGATQVNPWTNTHPKEFDALLDALTQGQTPVAAFAKETLNTDLGLSPEAFLRLMTIRDIDQLATSPGMAPSTDQWSEVYSILVQAQKTRLFAAWRTEEQQLQKPNEPTAYCSVRKISGSASANPPKVFGPRCCPTRSR
jgi:hypothetical protein